MIIACTVAAAFLLDLIFGDPACIPHPICLIGRMISGGERLARRIFPKTPRGEFIGGLLMSACVVLLCFGVPFFLLWLLARVHIVLALVVQLWFCFQIFAAKSLKKESMKVYTALEAGNLPEARKYLSYIVGRDTASLSEEAVAKAAVETVAENTSDGVVAPLLYMIIGGAPLAFAYKAVNTLDSMIGYKNEKYRYFGRFAARLDDVCNWIPARISGLVMIAASFLLRFDGKGAARIYRRDRRKHASPNSAQTESTCAGALGIQLGGDASYFGEVHHKPTIGDPTRTAEAADIARANRLMLGTSALAVLLAVVVRMAVWLILR